jgi:cytochrome c2
LYKLKTLALAGLVASLGGFASADSWSLNGDASRIAFGSVKKDTIGEIHSFETVTGSVSADGDVTVEIDLASVETLIDIRNERMIEHVFENAPKAVITARIDMAEVSSLSVGESTVVDTTGTLRLAGAEVALDTEMFIARISDGRVMVTTNDMIMLSMEDLGLTAGIDKLMQLADLPGITRVSPVTLRLVFDLDADKAEAPPAQATDVATTQVALAGDVESGKKIFRKCKACHNLAPGKNGVGPSLHAIVGAPQGGNVGFKYSDAIAGLGGTWTAETLAAFLSDPKGYAPGNKMGFAGLRKSADVEDVIAYLASQPS